MTEDVASGNIFDGVDASCVYFPTDVQRLTEMTLFVRARTDDVAVLRSAVTTAVKEVAPEMPFRVFPLRTLVGLGVWIFQAFSLAASLLSLVGLLFAYSGTHAVVSFLVAQRRREFGVRRSAPAHGKSCGGSEGDILHRLDRRCRRVTRRGRSGPSAESFSPDPAEFQRTSFCGRRRDRRRRDGRGRPGATARRRAHRSSASASNGVTFVR